MEQIPLRLDSPPFMGGSMFVRGTRIDARVLHHLWKVLCLFDSEVTARVSGAAETVDCFG